MSDYGPVVALCGGVGGAKLALGLSRVLPGSALSIVVNTGDDFDHLGLRICPDIDTVTYTLGGAVNPDTGWGRANDSGNFMSALGGLGGEDWFFLGDRDLALHVERSHRLRAGQSLSQVCADVARRFGIEARILPMTDDPVATVIDTVEGELAFQHYFVRERCEPAITGVRFRGADRARAPNAVLDSLADRRLRAVIICPSNPFVSIDPILAVPGIREALSECAAPVVAVSPLIGGAAVKGPTAKMMEELALDVTPEAVAAHYGELIDGLVLDQRDSARRGALEEQLDHVLVADTLMVDLPTKVALGRQILEWSDTFKTLRQAR